MLKIQYLNINKTKKTLLVTTQQKVTTFHISLSFWFASGSLLLIQI